MLDSPMLMFENGAMAPSDGAVRGISMRARVNVYVYVCIPSPARMRVCEMCVHSRRAATRTRVSIKVRSTPQDLVRTSTAVMQRLCVGQGAPQKEHVTKDSHMCVLRVPSR